MTRISTNQSTKMLLQQMTNNKVRVDKYSKEVSSGLKVFTPGDTRQAATITRLNEETIRIEGHEKRIGITQAHLNFQEQIMDQASNIITRAREVAEQMANETNSPDNRNIVSNEVWALRNTMADLANSVYQGRSIYGGVDDDDPPFDQDTTTYSTFGSANSQIRYDFDNYDPPPVIVAPPFRRIQVGDNDSVRISSPGDVVFGKALASLEKLGRALEGYRTDTTTPNYTAYTFPADFTLQTQAIRESLDELETARTKDIEPERSSIAERLHSLDLNASILSFTKEASKIQLSHLRDSDTAESATELSLAQTALQASYTVTSRMLNLSIMDYI